MGKRTDTSEITAAERRRNVVRDALAALMNSDPHLYYRPTADVARAIHENVMDSDRLGREDREAIERLSVRDIEAILSYR